MSCIWPLHFPLRSSKFPEIDFFFHFSKGCLFSTNKTFIFVCLIAPALLSPFYFFCFWLRGIWTICASKTVCLNSLQADFMVFKFFTLTFSLLLAIFITVLKSASFGNNRHSMRFFQKLLELERGCCLPLSCPAVPTQPSEAGAGLVSLGKGQLFPLASWREMQMPFICSTDLHDTQWRPRMMKSELPAYLLIPTFLRSCHRDPRLSMRYKAETKNTKTGRRIPSCPPHCCAMRESPCVIVPADMLFCFHFITVV